MNKAIYVAGIAVRNDSIFRNYKFLLESQHWDIKRLEQYQFDKLRELLIHSASNSRYYKEKYESAGFDPASVRSLSDMGRIPTVTKQDLITNVAAIHVRNYPEKLFFSETSGSTGKPLVFYRNKDWDAWHRASIYRGYHWHGVDPWERNGYLWGYNFSMKRRIKTIFLDSLQNRFRIFSYKDDDIDQFIAKLEKAEYLSGYSSMIYELAKRVNKRPEIKKRINLKMVKGTSEKIFDKYQVEVQEAFGRKMISEYGAAEAGIIAFECPKGAMHVNMETIIVEEVNNEIVVTNLVSKSFPIIRYRLGDYIALEKDKQCACGMRHHVIKEVLGRVGKVIYGRRHQYPSLTLYYVFKNLALEKGIVLNYQATQRKKGDLHVDIENRLSDAERSALSGEFKKYFGDDLNVDVTPGVDISSRSKKKADFISEVSQEGE